MEMMLIKLTMKDVDKEDVRNVDLLMVVDTGGN